MTRKDYVAVSAALKRVRELHATIADAKDRHAWYCSGLADVFAADNPRGFDRERFLLACGVQPAQEAQAVTLEDRVNAKVAETCASLQRMKL